MLVQHPTQKYINDVMDVVRSKSNQIITKSLNEQIKEWATMEFGGRWMDIELNEGDTL